MGSSVDSSAAVLVVILIEAGFALPLSPAALLASAVSYSTLKPSQFIIYCVFSQYILVECCVVDVVVHCAVCDVIIYCVCSICVCSVYDAQVMHRAVSINR